MKITYYAATSLDGFIAKKNGDCSWLETLGIIPEESGYNEFYDSVDGLIMGRKTYEMIKSFDMDWPYGDKPVWICSRNTIKGELPTSCRLERYPESVVTAAQIMNRKHLWLVGGGKLASSFIEKKLLTNLSISMMPILLGNGIPLLEKLSNDIALVQSDSTERKGVFTQLDYTLKY